MCRPTSRYDSRVRGEGLQKEGASLEQRLGKTSRYNARLRGRSQRVKSPPGSTTHGPSRGQNLPLRHFRVVSAYFETVDKWSHPFARFFGPKFFAFAGHHRGRLLTSSAFGRVGLFQNDLAHCNAPRCVTTPARQRIHERESLWRERETLSVRRNERYSR